MHGFHMALQDYSAAGLLAHDCAARRCAAGRPATTLDRRRRALCLVVLLRAALQTAADEGAGGSTNELRGVAITDLVAERAADDGARSRAGDRVLIFRRFRHGDLFIPAFLDGR